MLNMENSEIESVISSFKSTSTTQTEFVNALLIYLMISCSELDGIIEDNISEEMKGDIESVRSTVPYLIKRISDEVDNIHKNNDIILWIIIIMVELAG